MHENRTTYPKRKTEMYQQLAELPKKYKTISIIQMNKVRSTQILPLRKTLKGEVEFVCVKDRVAKKALETLDIPGMKEFSTELKGQICSYLQTCHHSNSMSY